MKKLKSATVCLGLILCISLAACSTADSLNNDDDTPSAIKQITLFSEGVVTPYGCTNSYTADLEANTFIYVSAYKETYDPEIDQEYGYDCAGTWTEEIADWEAENFIGLAEEASVADHDDVMPSGGPEDYCVGCYGTIVTVEFADGSSHEFEISGNICNLFDEDEDMAVFVNYFYYFHAVM